MLVVNARNTLADISIDDDIVVGFKDPENADGIVVSPKE